MRASEGRGGKRREGKGRKAFATDQTKFRRKLTPMAVINVFA